MSTRSRLRWLLLGAAVFLLVGPGVGWWYWRNLPDQLVSRARAAIAREQFDHADALAAQLDASTQPALGKLIRGESLIGQGRWAAALQELSPLRDDEALRVRVVGLSARCLLEMGRLREAFDAFWFVQDKDPDNVDAQRGLAAIAYDLGNLTMALTHLDKVAHLDPADGRSLRLSALIRTFLGQDSQAEVVYRSALERNLSPTFRSQVYLELAEALYRMTRYDDALAELDRRLKLDGREDDASYSIRSECLYNLNRREELKQVLDAGLAEYPGVWQMLVIRGQLYLEDRQPERALEVLLRAAKEAPGQYRVRLDLAKAYRALGRDAEAAVQEKLGNRAQANLKKMHDLSHEAMQRPWDRKVRLTLAEVCDELDNKKLAAMWRKAARSCPSEE